MAGYKILLGNPLPGECRLDRGDLERLFGQPSESLPLTDEHGYTIPYPSNTYPKAGLPSGACRFAMIGTFYIAHTEIGPFLFKESDQRWSPVIDTSDPTGEKERALEGEPLNAWDLLLDQD